MKERGDYLNYPRSLFTESDVLIELFLEGVENVHCVLLPGRSWLIAFSEMLVCILHVQIYRLDEILEGLFIRSIFLGFNGVFLWLQPFLHESFVSFMDMKVPMRVLRVEINRTVVTTMLAIATQQGISGRPSLGWYFNPMRNSRESLRFLINAENSPFPR